MNKKLFLLLVIVSVFVFSPKVYAETVNLVCDVKKAEMGTCQATFDTATNKATVVITKTSEFATFGEPSVVNGGTDVEAEFDGQVVTSGNTKTYVITNASSSSKIMSNLSYMTFMYADPECETGGGTVEVDPPSPVPYEDIVTLRVKPDTCYELETLKVVGVSSSREYATTKNEDGTYSFVMPGEDVKIVVRFKKMANCPNPDTPPTATPSVNPTPTPDGVKVPDTDTYSYLTTFITLIIISSVGFVLYKKVS